VAVPIGLDYGHHLGRPGMFAQHGYVVRDGAKVDDGLAVDRRGL